jgi:hypothetical protein
VDKNVAVQPGMMSPLLGFAKLTHPDGEPMVVAIDEIAIVVGSLITLKHGHQFAVQESHDDILLRIGLPITPRAETIMKP